MEKSPDRFGIHNFLFKRKLGIRKQVQRIIFICCIVSFVTVGVIALAGMFSARQNSIKDGGQMGERAAEITADKLENAERRRISLLARERAKVVYSQLKRMEDCTRILSGCRLRWGERRRRACRQCIGFYGSPVRVCRCRNSSRSGG